MADSVSSSRRSEIMSHIKSKYTSIELMVRQRLFAMVYRYRVNYKEHIPVLEADGWKVIMLWECEVKEKFDELFQTLNCELLRQ